MSERCRDSAPLRDPQKCFHSLGAFGLCWLNQWRRWFGVGTASSESFRVIPSRGYSQAKVLKGAEGDQVEIIVSSQTT